MTPNPPPRQIEAVEEIEGFDALTKGDQDQVREKMTEMLDAKSAPKPKKKVTKKRKKVDDDEDAADAEGDVEMSVEEEKPKKKATKPKKAKKEARPENWRDFNLAEANALAQEVAEMARREGIRMPRIDDIARRKAGQSILSHREDNRVNLGAVLDQLQKDYGSTANQTPIEVSANAQQCCALRSSPSGKPMLCILSGKDLSCLTGAGVGVRLCCCLCVSCVRAHAYRLSPFPLPGGVQAAIPENSKLAEQFNLLSFFYFKQKRQDKGIVYAKVSKAVVGADFAITSGKEAQTINGVGKKSGVLIDEYLESGVIQELENFLDKGIEEASAE